MIKRGISGLFNNITNTHIFIYLCLINQNQYPKKNKIQRGSKSKLWRWLGFIFIMSECVGPWVKQFTNRESIYYLNVLDYWSADTYVENLFVIYSNIIISKCCSCYFIIHLTNNSKPKYYLSWIFCGCRV